MNSNSKLEYHKSLNTIMSTSLAKIYIMINNYYEYDIILRQRTLYYHNLLPSGPGLLNWVKLGKIGVGGYTDMSC